MADLVFVILYASIIALFIECLVVFRNWKEKVHAYLFLASVSNLVNNIGYVMEIKSSTLDSYLTALQQAYAGRIWIPFALFLFSAELVRFKIPVLFRDFLILVHVVLYAMVLTIKENNLYYKNIRFTADGPLPAFHFDSGIGHSIFNLLLLFYVLAGMAILLRAFFKEKHVIMQKRLVMVIIAMVTESLFAILQMSQLVPVSELLDLTMIGYPIGTVFMLIAIFRYKLLDTAALARDYVIDELSEGIIAVDGQGNLSLSNKPATRLFPDLEVSVHEVTERLDKTIETCEPMRLNDRLLTPEKNTLYQGENLSGTIYVLKDDTEHYRYMDELKEQKRIADKANTAKSAFLANMSHEIRTPINAILGMDEMILRESGEEDVLVYADNIRTAGTTLLSLINDILDFSKIEAGKLEIIPVEYDTASMLNDLVNMIEPRAEAKDLRLRCEIDPALPGTLFGDEIRIKQIITNILTNAVKYTEDGSVTFWVSFEKIDVGTAGLKVSVADTGIGIKEKDIAKLFSPFERIEEERNHAIEGTGLGMNITRQLLAMMDSRLEVKSVYGEGSTFSFTIAQRVVSWEAIGDFKEALRKAKESRTGYKESFIAPDAKILVVDDTPMNLTVIQGLLKRTKMSVTTAEKGEEAIRLAKAQDFDLIFLDHMMPDMDGVQTLRHLREETDVAVKNTPIVCLTANALSGAKEQYLAVGFTDYLTKPVEPEELEGMLIRYLPEEKVTLTELGEDKNQKEEIRLPEKLLNLSGVDAAAGILTCGSPENYLEALRTASGNMADSISMVEDAKNRSAWNIFTIKVHAIKSSMRIIGATGISVLAEGLEAAGNAQDINRIEKDTPELLARMRVLNEELLSVFSEAKEDELPMIDPVRLEEAYMFLAQSAESFDIESIDMVLESLREYRLPDEEKPRLEKIRHAARNLDWEKMAEALEQEP